MNKHYVSKDYIPNVLIPVKGILDTKEKVEKARQGLEKATEEAFKEFDKAQARARIKSKYIALD